MAATGLIRPLSWEPPYAVGATLEKAKRKKIEGSYPNLDTTSVFITQFFTVSILGRIVCTY